ncbi:MAG: TonB-dependent receptor [Bacteroidota bacterium]
MFRKILLSVFIIWSSLSFAQSLKVKVIDKVSREPISYADVFFYESKTGTSTDEEGYFHAQDFASHQLKVLISFIGYKTLSTTIYTSEDDIVLEMEKSHITLEDVIVAVPGGKLQSENIVAIENRKLNELYTSSPINLSGAIAEIPGVDQISVGASVGKPIIRGLTGNRILTYSQGIRVENQQWGADHGLGISDIGIESVEVIKGPASLLYGSDALAGVIYFVDERYAKQNSIEGSAQTKYFFNNKQTQNQLGLKINKGKFSLNAFGGLNKASDYKLPSNENVYNTRFEDQNLKLSLGYAGKSWISNLRYSYFENSYGIAQDSIYDGNSINKIEIPFVSLTTNSLSFDNTVFTGDSKLNLILGYSNDVRKAHKVDFNNANINMGLETFTYNLKWYSTKINNKFSIILGSQGMHQSNKNSGLGMVIPDYVTRDIGLFSLVNYSSGNFDIQGGLRADYRLINSEEKKVGDFVKFPEFTNDYKSINYSIGSVYKLNKAYIRANLSSGFRAPNSAELLSNGSLGSVNRYVKGNQNLVSEFSNQFDIGLNYTNDHLNFSVNPFFNNINNYIFLAPKGELINNIPVYEYKQKDAILYGGEMGIHIHPHGVHWLHIRSDISTVFAEDKNGNPLPLIPATRINNTLKVMLSKGDVFRIKNIFIQDIYKFDQNRIGQFETETQSYNLINAGAELEIRLKNYSFLIDTGVKNLLNTKYIDHLSRLKYMDIEGQGINFYMGIKFNIETRLNTTK